MTNEEQRIVDLKAIVSALSEELDNKRGLLKILQEQFDQAIEQRNIAQGEAAVLRDERDNALRIGTEYRQAAERLQLRIERLVGEDTAPKTKEACEDTHTPWYARP